MNYTNFIKNDYNNKNGNRICSNDSNIKKNNNIIDYNNCSYKNSQNKYSNRLQPINKTKNIINSIDLSNNNNNNKSKNTTLISSVKNNYSNKDFKNISFANTKSDSEVNFSDITSSNKCFLNNNIKSNLKNKFFTIAKSNNVFKPINNKCNYILSPIKKSEKSLSQILNRMHNKNVCNEKKHTRNLLKSYSNINISNNSTDNIYKDRKYSILNNTYKTFGNKNCNITNENNISRLNLDSNDNLTLQDKLKFLFNIYCQYCYKNNFNNLKCSQFIKFCKDADLIDDNILTEQQVNLIYLENVCTYSKRNNSNILNNNKLKSNFNHICKFEHFLNLLKILAAKTYLKSNTNINLSQSLKYLINNNVLNLYKKLSNLKELINNNSDKIYKAPKRFRSCADNNQYKNEIIIKDTKKQSFLMNKILKTDYLIDYLNNNSDLGYQLNTLTTIFYDIYKCYFSNEFSIKNTDSNNNKVLKNFIHNKIYINRNADEKKRKESKNNFIVFLADFELCPVLINKNDAFTLFNNSLVDSKDNKFQSSIIPFLTSSKFINTINISTYEFPLGEEFTFLGLILSIIKISDYGFYKIATYNTTNITEVKEDYFNLYQKFIILLERMERSNGLSKMRKKYLISTSNAKNSKFLPFDHVYLSNYIFNNSILNYKKSVLYDNYNISKLENNNKINIDKLEFKYNNYISNSFGTELTEIFLYYALDTNKSNKEKMNLNNFNTFLEDAELLSKERKYKNLKFDKCNDIKNKYQEEYNIYENNCNTTENNISFKKDNEMQNSLEKNIVEVIFYKVLNKDIILNKLENNIANISNDNSGVITNIGNSSNISNPSNKITTCTNKNNKNLIISDCLLDYQDFINTIEIIANIIKNNFKTKDAINNIMNKNILPLYNNIIKKDIENLQNFYNEKNNNEFYVSIIS